MRNPFDLFVQLSWKLHLQKFYHWEMTLVLLRNEFWDIFETGLCLKYKAKGQVLVLKNDLVHFRVVITYFQVCDFSIIVLVTLTLERHFKDMTSQTKLRTLKWCTYVICMWNLSMPRNSDFQVKPGYFSKFEPLSIIRIFLSR